MNSSRIWLFRSLVLIAIGLLLTSWFMPWWSCYIEATNIENTLIIHPWALENNAGTFDYVIPKHLMPDWFALFMWAYLGLAVASLLIGAWIKDKNIELLGRNFNISRWLIGIVGFSYIVVVILAVVVAAIRTGELGVAFVGSTFIALDWMEQSWVHNHLLFGYWLACGVGPILVFLSLFRNKIIGKAKSITT